MPWRREWQPTPVFLPGKFQGQRSLVGYSTWGRKESDTTERLTLSLSVPLRLWHWKPQFCGCWWEASLSYFPGGPLQWATHNKAANFPLSKQIRKQESMTVMQTSFVVVFFFFEISKMISHPVCQILFFRVNQWIQPTLCKRGRDTGANSSLVAQMVKCLPAIQETRVWSLGWEDPLEKEMATHSSTLAWKIPWMEETDRLQSTGSQSQTWLRDFTFSFTYRCEY